MAIVELTSQRNTRSGGASTTVAFNFPSAPTQDNLIACAFTWRSDATVTGVPAGWTLATNTGNGTGIDGAIYYKIAGASEPTAATFTLSASVASSGAASEWSGIAASPLDKVSSSSSAATTTVSAGSTTALYQENELVLSLFGSIDTITHTLNNGQTVVGTAQSTGSPSSSLNTSTLGSKIVSALTAISNAATSSSSQICAGATATFKSTMLPDVTVTSVSYADGVFSCTIQNIGNAQTPAGVVVGHSYLVDGTYRTWGAIDGPLAAGASANIGMGGAPYVVPVGTHTIAAQTDDLNRFAESDKSNNVLSVTINIHAGAGSLAGQDAVITGSAARGNPHTANGDLTGQGSSVSSNASRFRTHTTSGALNSGSAAISAAVKRFRAMTASGSLPGQTAAISGNAARFRAHQSSGALSGASATVSGSITRFRLMTASGSLVGQPAAISANAIRFREHQFGGALPGGSAAISGNADRITVSATHAASGDLPGKQSAINGVSARSGTHGATGDLSAQVAVINGVALHPHISFGVLTGQASLLIGTANHRGTHICAGSLIGQSAVIAGYASAGGNELFSSVGVTVDYATQSIQVSL